MVRFRSPLRRRLHGDAPTNRRGTKPLGLEPLEPRIVLDSTVVFNEVMYHPADDSTPEWIELYNQNAVNMDLSGWSLTGGAQYTFPAGTVLAGGDYLVLSSDPDAMLTATGVAGSLGPLTGRLANGGERIELRSNTDRIMDSLAYDDRSPWPVGPDGSGVTLAKLSETLSTAEPGHWTSSAQMGGTPGARNFAEPGELVFQPLVAEVAPARARVPLDGSLGLDWIQPSYDDSSWTHGTTAIGYDTDSGDDTRFGLDLTSPPDGQTPIPMQRVNQTIYVRIPFTVGADSEPLDSLLLRMRYDDGFVAYLNGTEVAHANAPGRDGNPGTLAWYSAAPRARRTRDVHEFAEFDVTAFRDVLTAGENVLAIHGLNKGLTGTSGDLLLQPELLGGRQVKLDPRLSLALNEIGPAGDHFSVELANTGDQPIELSGVVLSAVGGGADGGQYIFAPQTLASGQYTVVTASQLGGTAAEGQRLFLYAPDRQRLLDAALVTARLRGRSDRFPDTWMYPSAATPGHANQFAFHDQVVINEIMYHAAPQYAQAETPPTYRLTTLLPLDATWRYNPEQQNLGWNWQQTIYPTADSSWHDGPGPLGTESSRSAEPLGTNLPAPSRDNAEAATYYFQTEFELAPPVEHIDTLQLTHLVDDGAVFYLNGHEILRYNMPASIVFAATEAAQSVRNVQPVGPVTVSTQFLRPGKNVLSAEVHLASRTSNAVVFGARLEAGQQLEPGTPAVPFRESEEEWIELLNRSSTETVDLSGWKLDEAIEFTFPDGTTLGPNQYLVIAKEPRAVEAAHSGILPSGSVLGPFSRSLSDRDELLVLLDAQANIADQVHYFDGNPWPDAADGGGSSLELRDPNADNLRAEAWAASDESGVLGRAPWQHYSYTRTVEKPRYDPPINFHEFHMGMLDAGEVLLDNIRVVEDPGRANVQLLQNGDFESDRVGQPADKWRIQGTHEDSRVIADPDEPNNKVLHLVAEARANYFGNHAETTLANRQRVDDGKTYQISFDAKWISGSPQLHTELYYKDAARTTILRMPDRAGTPGARNSQYQPNIGPTVSQLRHQPVVPKQNQPITVSVSADDPDGISSVILVWSVNGEAFSRVPMIADADAGFSATIPGQKDRAVIQFYVEATDTRQATSLYPAAGPDSRALLKVDDDFKPDPLRHDFQIIMLPAEARNLHATTEYIDNDRTGSTVIYRGKEIFYDVGTRLKGSMYSRNSQERAGFNIRFHPDQRFRGVHESVTLDRANPQEILVKHLIRQAGMLGGMYDDVVNLATPLGRGDGPTPLQMARFGDVYLDSQFENGSDGTVYKFEGIRVMLLNGRPEGLKTYQPIGWVSNFDITDLGDDKELYRWPFLITNNRAKDDFSRLIDMAKAFSLEGQPLQDAVADVLDIDQWMQTFAMMSLAGIGDVYSQGNPHNLDFYQRPEDNKMLVFPWDWDFTFSRSANSPLHGGKNIGKIISLPVYERLFLGHMRDMINTVFNEDYMSDWLSHYGKMLGTSYASNANYIRQRGQFVMSRMPEQVPMRITTNGGEALTTTRSTLGIEGKGWIDVREIRRAGQTEPMPVTWTGIDTWRVDVPLVAGPNTIALEAYDAQGAQVGSDQIVVTYQPEAAVGDVLISEVHYHNVQAPRVGRAVAEDFDFVELTNRGDSAADLSRWRISGAIDYVFPDRTSLAAGESIVVFPFEPSDVTRKFSLEVLFAVQSSSLPLQGPYAGQLSDDGGWLRLERPGSALPQDPDGLEYDLVDEVLYDNLPPWPIRAGGDGASLNRRSPTALGVSPTSWSAREPTPGSATLIDRQPGDANGDGQFDSSDILAVSAAGKYLADEPATFQQGDWNQDGRFDQRDVIEALQAGSYMLEVDRAQLVDAVFSGTLR